MKKLFCFMTLFVLAICLFVGCDQNVETKTFTVSFDANGSTGNEPSPITVQEGKTFSFPSCGSLENEGYDFDGWNTDPDGSGTMYYAYWTINANSDMKLYAQWKLHSYRVVYDLRGGAFPQGKENLTEYTLETETFSPTVQPSREGYEFVGWKFYGEDDSSARKDISIEKGSKGDKRIVAVWRQLDSWKISYDPNGGTGSIPTQIRYEGSSVAISEPTGIERNGYKFNSWNTQSDGSGDTYKPGDIFEKDEELVLYARWDIITYKIEYELAGGSLPDNTSNPETYTIESDTFALASPVRDGYAFLGWRHSSSGDWTAKENLEVQKGTYGNLSFVAVWRILDTYTVSIYANKSSYEEPFDKIDVKEKQTYTIPDASGISRTGYDFKGWNTNANGYGTSYEPGQDIRITSSLKLYAQWSIIEYQIDYDLSGGELPNGKSNPTQYTVNTSTFRLNNPIKEGCLFLGWLEQVDVNENQTPNKSASVERGSTGNRKFTAVWGHTISYDANGGEGNIDSQIKVEGSVLGLASSKDISRKGYTFMSWNTKSDGKGTTYQECEEIEEDCDITLYAIWSLDTYKIEYELKGGSLDDDIVNPEQYTVETSSFTLSNPQRDYWNFIGWKETGSSDSSAIKTVRISKGSVGDRKFTAVWGHTISYDANGGTGKIADQIKYEGTVLKLATEEGLSRKGYSFICWNSIKSGEGTDYGQETLFKGDYDLVLYAKWKLLEYKITYDLNGGLLPEGQENPTNYTVETETFELENPTKEGFSFIGWKFKNSADSTAVGRVEIAKGSIGDKSFVAVWGHTVSYDLNGGSGNVEDQIKYEGNPLTLASNENFSRLGYEFTGWNTKDDGTGDDYNANDVLEEEIDLVLYAKWELCDYAIVYELNGGSLSEGTRNPEEYTVLTPTFTLVNPSKDGFKFQGWKLPKDSVSDATKTVSVKQGSVGDKVYEAVWGNSISYNANGGVGAIDSQIKYEGEPLALAPADSVSRNGYSFVCWNTKADGSGTDYYTKDSLEDEIGGILYAKWGDIKYRITYDLAGGSFDEGSSNPDEYTVSTATFTLKNPARYGYRFLGWKLKGNNDSTAKTEVTVKKGSTGNLSFVAVWQWLKRYTITYNMNDGSGSMESQTKLEDESVVLLEPSIYENGGLVFSCWNTRADGSGTDYGLVDPYDVNSNLSLYAKWIPDNIVYDNQYSNRYTAVGVRDNSISELEIPPFYRGMKVTYIANYSLPYEECNTSYNFSCCNNLSKVTIPWTIESSYSYSEGVFSSCKNLKEMVFSEGLKTFPSYLLKGVLGVESVTVPSTVTAIDTMIDESSGFVGSGVKEVIFADGIKGIPDSFLSYASDITSVTIPASVKFIGGNAFRGCSGLTAVLIPEGVEALGLGAFGGCTGLTSVTIPSSINKVDAGFYSSDGVFYGCSNLKEIKLTEGMKVLPMGIFVGINLESLTIPSTVISITWDNASIASYSHIGVLEFAEGMKKIPAVNFPAYGSGDYFVIDAVKIPSSADFISDNAFRGFKNLTNISIPEGVERIGSYAFANCSSLSKVTIPSTIRSFDSNVFEQCYALREVVFSDGLTTIPSNAISGLADTGWSYSELKVVIPKTVKVIASDAFGNVPIGHIVFEDGMESIPENALTSVSHMVNIYVEMPDSVKSIGSDAFSGFMNGISLELPPQLESIGASAFEGTSMTSVTLPSKLKSIGNLAFCSCGINDVIIPESIVSIGVQVFDSNLSNVVLNKYICENKQVTDVFGWGLKSVTIPGNVTKLSANLFQGCSSLITINYGSTVEAWKSLKKGSNWDFYTIDYTVFCTNGSVAKETESY